MLSSEITIYYDGCNLQSIQNPVKSVLTNSNLFQGNQASFVGLIATKDEIAIFLPKRYKYDIRQSKPRKDAKSILELLLKYQASHKYDQKLFGIDSTFQDDKGMLNLLANYRVLIEFYREKGLYSRRNSNQSSTGKGKINWSRTIKTETPLFSKDNIPIYTKVRTRYSANTEVSSIVAIQKYFTAVADMKIGWIFSDSDDEVLFYELSELLIKAPGTNSYMLHQLMKERSRVFDNERLRLLDALISIIQNRLSTSLDEQVIGVKYFWPIWEAILKKIFSDSSRIIIGKLPIPVYQYGYGTRIASNTLVPDIVLLNSTSIAVLDAKYYDTNNRLPGWHDIVKQSFYKNTIERLTGLKVKSNAFIFPGDDEYTSPVSVIIKDRNEDEFFDEELYPKISCINYSINKAILCYLRDEKDVDFISKALK